jgi:hypothetical protein
VELIRNGKILYSPLQWGATDRIDLEFTDDKVPAGTSYYYLKVQQLMHGEYVNAWSSPIWVTKPPAGE